MTMVSLFCILALAYTFGGVGDSWQEHLPATQSAKGKPQQGKWNFPLPGVTAITWYEDAHRASHKQVGCLHCYVVLTAKHVVAVTRLHIGIWTLWQVDEVSRLALNCVLAARRIRATRAVYSANEHVVSGTWRRKRVYTSPNWIEFKNLPAGRLSFHCTCRRGILCIYSVTFVLNSNISPLVGFTCRFKLRGIVIRRLLKFCKGETI